MENQIEDVKLSKTVCEATKEEPLMAEQTMFNLQLNHYAISLDRNINIRHYKAMWDLFNEPGDWWYKVYKPFDRKYNEYYENFYGSHKSMDHAIRENPRCNLILTRERISAKEHINLLVQTTTDLSGDHEKCTRWYKLHCKKVTNTLPDKVALFNYIFKEASERFFDIEQDYTYIWRVLKNK